MSKYQNSKVYKIISNSNPDLVYYGSTYCKLSNRLAKHKSSYKLYLKRNLKYMTSFLLVKLDDCKIILVEKYPCIDKEELRMRERFYIENNPCVNKNIPSRTRKEYSKIYRENNIEKEKERHKKYRENNIEKEKEYSKIYREDNREKLKENSRRYYENNREKERERSKNYYENNKEKLNKKKRDYM